MSSEKTFSDVQTMINSAQDGDTIKLDGIYKRSYSEKQIVVNKSVTIIGDNATLDCDNGQGIFSISAQNVLINNVNFINSWRYANGGAIEVLNSNCSIFSCNFTNNFAKHGGAIYAQEDTLISDCIFIDNLADEEYGADNYIIENGIVKNCYFDRCFGMGGVIWNCVVENCYFHNSTAVKPKSIKNCVFEDYFRPLYLIADGSIVNCTITKARYILAINNLNVSLINCTFKDNFKVNTCISIMNSTAEFINCNLINNTVSESNAIKLMGNCTVKLIDCVVENTTMDSGVLVQHTTKLSATNLNVVYNTGKYPIITLKDSLGNPVGGAKLAVNVGSNKLTLNTDKNGQAKITKSLVPKTYTTNIVFAGDDQYVSSALSTKIVIKKATPKLTAPNKSYKVKATKKLTATLKDNKGKVLKGKKVTFKLKGKTYSANTNSKGVATVTVKITSKGTFNVAVKFAGDSYFSSVSKSIKLTVKK